VAPGRYVSEYMEWKTSSTTTTTTTTTTTVAVAAYHEK
jgi:hypothetical protein